MFHSRRGSFDPEALFERAYAILPGAAIALVIGAVAHRFLGEWLPVSSLLIAILLGMALRTLGWVPWWAESGLKWAAKVLLRIGIVLLGLQLALGDIISLGWEVLVIVVITVVVTFLGMRLLGQVFGTGTATTALLATGTSICGASAVAAAASVLDRGDGRDSRGRPLGEAAATALAVVTLWGTVAMLALPLLAPVLNLGASESGVWIGASVHEVGQVVAAGGMMGATALAVATVVKLARVLMLAPMVVAVRLVDGRTGSGPGAGRAPIIPLFVLGFLAAVLVSTFASIPAEASEFIAQVAAMLLTIAMAGVGAAVDLRTLLRTGGPALLLGGAGSVLASAVALIGIALLL